MCSQSLGIVSSSQVSTADVPWPECSWALCRAAAKAAQKEMRTRAGRDLRPHTQPCWLKWAPTRSWPGLGKVSGADDALGQGSGDAQEELFGHFPAWQPEGEHDVSLPALAHQPLKLHPRLSRWELLLRSWCEITSQST